MCPRLYVYLAFLTLLFIYRNALSLAMLTEVTKELTRDVDGGDLRAIIIASEGPVYSAGHDLKELVSPRPLCTKLTIDGNFAINGNYHRILDFDWLLSPVTMVVAIDGKVAINGSFMQQGPSLSSPTVECGVI